MSTPIEQVNELNRRIRAGEDVSRDEMALVMDALRKQRATSHESGEKRVAKANPQPLDLDALFEETKK